jgi:hypothetical protein
MIWATVELHRKKVRQGSTAESETIVSSNQNSEPFEDVPNDAVVAALNAVEAKYDGANPKYLLLNSLEKLSVRKPNLCLYLNLYQNSHRTSVRDPAMRRACCLSSARAQRSSSHRLAADPTAKSVAEGERLGFP